MPSSVGIKMFFIIISALIFLAMVMCQLMGRAWSTHRRGAGKLGDGSAAIEAAVFALLGLLVAFSFSGAESRLQMRRDLIVKEVNAIGTAYLRLDLLPKASRPALKQTFRDYVDARLAYYKKFVVLDAAHAERERAEALQRQIWAEALEAAAKAPDLRATVLVVPALNDMFDVTTAREAALRMHIPIAVFVMLAGLSVACAFLSGIRMAPPERMSPLHVITFAGSMALTAYVILNIEFPRLGFVRLDALDTFLAQLRATMT